MKTFNPMFDQAVAKTERALATFQHAMNQVDADLRRIISQRPELLDEAEDLQAMRGFDFTRAELVPSEQPAPPVATAVLEEGVESAPVTGPTPLVDPAQVADATDAPSAGAQALTFDAATGDLAPATQTGCGEAAHTAGTNHADQGPDWAKG